MSKPYVADGNFKKLIILYALFEFLAEFFTIFAQPTVSVTEFYQTSRVSGIFT